MSYVDFVCIPLPKENVEKYKLQIELFATIMKENGLISYCEALADDVPRGENTDWFKAVQAKDGETVVNTFLKWPDKATRDKAWDNGMKDPRLAEMMNPENSLFDGKRMFWGGFSTLFEI